MLGQNQKTQVTDRERQLQSMPVYHASNSVAADLVNPRCYFQVCALTGLGGEHAEFRAVRWAQIDDVVRHAQSRARMHAQMHAFAHARTRTRMSTQIESMWPAKRKPYESLRDWAQPECGSLFGACRWRTPRAKG